MDVKEKKLEKKTRNSKGGMIVFCVIVAVIAVLIAAFGKYFSFLEDQLFEDRKSHLVEFTDKASEIIESVVEYSWKQVFACEYVIRSKGAVSEKELFDVLVSTGEFIDFQYSIVLAIDKNGKYYSSDSNKGRWIQTELLTEKAEPMQQIVSEIPHKNGYSYFVFMERLDNPIMVGENLSPITYLAVALDIDCLLYTSDAADD